MGEHQNISQWNKSFSFYAQITLAYF